MYTQYDDNNDDNSWYDIINERDDEITKIQSELSDVNKLFQSMSTLLYNQGSDVDNIMNNIQSSKDNVKQANKSLDNANDEVKSTPWTLIGVGVTISTVVVAAVTSIILL